MWGSCGDGGLVVLSLSHAGFVGNEGSCGWPSVGP